jgi:hypothetical protein
VVLLLIGNMYSESNLFLCILWLAVKAPTLHSSCFAYFRCLLDRTVLGSFCSRQTDTKSVCLAARMQVGV